MTTAVVDALLLPRHHLRVPDLTTEELSTSSPSPIELHGWRVVRVLGTSTTATTALVQQRGATDPARPRVLRLYSATLADDHIDREIAVHDALSLAAESLRSAAHASTDTDATATNATAADATVADRPHWVRAEALVSADDGRFGVLVEAVVGPNAEAWLHDHAPLRLGEVTTLLSPIADAVHAAHDHGVLGIVPRLRDVRIDAVGTPIIVKTHNGVVRPALPERFRAQDAHHDLDRRALARLTRELAEHLETNDRSIMLSIAESAHESPRALRDALMRCARPEPLTVAVPRQASVLRIDETHDPVFPSAVPHPDALTDANFSGEPQKPGRVAELRSRLGDVLESLALPPSLRASVDVSLERAHSALERWRGAVRSTRSETRVRPRFIALGAAGLAAAMIMLAILVPSGGAGSDAQGGSTQQEGGTASDEAALDEAALDERARDATPLDPSSTDLQSVASPPGAESSFEYIPDRLENPNPDEWSALVQQLLERWSACRANAGEGCASSVVQPRSAAAILLAVDDERHAIIDAWLLGSREFVIVEQMGSAVLVDLIESERTTASLLLMRSEAGWRVRDVLD